MDADLQSPTYSNGDYDRTPCSTPLSEVYTPLSETGTSFSEACTPLSEAISPLSETFEPLHEDGVLAQDLSPDGPVVVEDDDDAAVDIPVTATPPPSPKRGTQYLCISIMNQL